MTRIFTASLLLGASLAFSASGVAAQDRQPTYIISKVSTTEGGPQTFYVTIDGVSARCAEDSRAGCRAVARAIRNGSFDGEYANLRARTTDRPTRQSVKRLWAQGVDNNGSEPSGDVPPEPEIVVVQEPVVREKVTELPSDIPSYEDIYGDGYPEQTRFEGELSVVQAQFE